MPRIFLLLALWPLLAISQPTLPHSVSLDDLSEFATPAGNWQVVGAVSADLDKELDIETKEGQGILVNIAGKGEGKDLFTSWQHRDIDLSFEFMMPKDGNSGVYLMGRYEVQLRDSWGRQAMTFADCGGIYERWDESRPDGEKGFQGYPPRQQAARAPGLWQRVDISFRAPRFGADGHKVENARILSLHLNGTLLHENIELTGPTRGSAFAEEGLSGPLRFQGDHGPVAFRNIRFQLFSDAKASVGPFDYAVFLGKFDDFTTVNKLTPDRTGKTELLTQEVAGEQQDFVLRLRGPLTVPESGTYHLLFGVLQYGLLSIDGQPVADPARWRQEVDVELTAGTHDLEILYYKDAPWYDNGLALAISGPGLRQQMLHALSSMPQSNPTDPHFLPVGAKPHVMRCFIDYQESQEAERRRIVHAINVGFPERLSYTFDPDRAAWVQVWKGEFLDATPMWNSRGDGSSRPLGSTLTLGDQAGIGQLVGEGGPWPAEIPEKLAYTFEGYRVDAQGLPTFLYTVDKGLITDHVHSPDAASFIRTLTAETSIPSGMYLRAGHGTQIIEVSKGRYSVDQRYYVELIGKAKPTIREVDGTQELLLPLRGGDTVSYRLVW